MTRRELSVPVAGGTIGGWLAGDGPRVLLLHGGPGMNASYLDGLADEFATDYQVAWFQQRGLPPSMEDGPFDIAIALDDVAAVLEHLGWDTAYVVGHSWGGHLALHVARSLGHRVTAALIVDPLGAVGDGGEQAMEDEFTLRVPAYSQMWESIHAEIAGLEAALPNIAVPTGFVVGLQSPIPPSASYETAARIPGAWVDEVDGAGHMIWMERPGAVKASLDKLVAG